MFSSNQEDSCTSSILIVFGGLLTVLLTTWMTSDSRISPIIIYLTVLNGWYTGCYLIIACLASLTCTHIFREKSPLSENIKEETERRKGTIILRDNKENSGPGAKCTLSDLCIKQTLGVGAFGRVKLVKHKRNGCNYALKCLSKKALVENEFKENIINEKNILAELDHPFISKFHGAFQDQKQIYFLLEVLIGGELFTYLNKETLFPESWSRFYAASVITAFSQIHSKKIAYRDLKPENMVLDSSGYVKIVDFGLAKKIEDKTFTFCGTQDYMAPEIVLDRGHGIGVDYWALGIFIYEMTAGVTPFESESPDDVDAKIIAGKYNVPGHFSTSLADLIEKLLCFSERERLGMSEGGMATLCDHEWFSNFDWNSLLNKEMRVPIKPKLKNFDDSSNFDFYEEEDVKDIDYSLWYPKGFKIC